MLCSPQCVPSRCRKRVSGGVFGGCASPRSREEARPPPRAPVDILGEGFSETSEGEASREVSCESAVEATGWAARWQCTSKESLVRARACSRALREVSRLAEAVETGWTSAASSSTCEVWRRASDDPDGPTVWKSEATYAVGAEALVEILADADGHAAWNPTCLGYEVLATLDDLDDLGRPTRITRTTSCSELGGLVASRDFVNLNRVERRGASLLVGGASLVDDLAYPPLPGVVRGFNGPCGWYLRPRSEASVHLTYIINSDLQGWLSRKCIDLAISNVMLRFDLALRAHLDAAAGDDDDDDDSPTTPARREAPTAD